MFFYMFQVRFLESFSTRAAHSHVKRPCKVSTYFRKKEGLSTLFNRIFATQKLTLFNKHNCSCQIKKKSNFTGQETSNLAPLKPKNVTAFSSYENLQAEKSVF